LISAANFVQVPNPGSVPPTRNATFSAFCPPPGGAKPLWILRMCLLRLPRSWRGQADHADQGLVRLRALLYDPGSQQLRDGLYPRRPCPGFPSALRCLPIPLWHLQLDPYRDPTGMGITHVICTWLFFIFRTTFQCGRTRHVDIEGFQVHVRGPSSATTSSRCLGHAP
jgi:hypothetical protein